MRKIQKNESRGITLIALVVTIVVLLILAGISISIVLGEGGIIDSARKAGEETNAAIANEQQMLQNVVNWVDEYLSGNTPPTEEPTLESLVGQEANDENIVIEDEKGKPKIVIPGKYRVVGPKQDETIDYGEDKIPTIEEGVVIQDEAGNQFVWVPVAEVSKMYTTLPEEDNRKIGQLYDFGTSTTPNKPAIKRNYTKGKEYREPDVLESTTNGDAVENDPTKGIQQLQTVVGIEGTGKEEILKNWKKQLQNEFDRMIASVEAYGGFYIGRYETGNLKSEEAKPIVQKGNEKISNVNWYWMYKNSKEIATGEKVESSMIWGSQWDAVMNWYLSDEKTAGYVTNSDGNGNYKPESGSGSKKATGSDPAYRVKNIYDMAGNVYEWTLEAGNTSSRVYRGGNYLYSGSFNPASYRSGDSPYSAYEDIGSRSTLLCNPES